MSRIPQQPKRSIPRGAQSPTRPPVTAQAPDVQGVRDSLELVKQVLGAAYQEVQDQARQLLQQCKDNHTETVGCVRSALNTALQSAYKTKSDLDYIVKANVAYLMSAAQQYASLLGYQPLGFDLSQLPSDVAKTVDIVDPVTPGGVDKDKPLLPGVYNVVPRYPGYPDDVRAQEPLVFNARPDPRDPNASAYAVASINTPTIGGNVQAPFTLVPPSQQPVIAQQLTAQSTPISQALPPSSVGAPSVPPPATVAPTGSPVGVATPPAGATGQAGITVSGPSKGVPRSQLQIAPGGAFAGTTTPPIDVSRIGGATEPAPPGVVTPPLPDGCPTSLTGLPTVMQLDTGQVQARLGMWVTDGQCAYKVMSEPDAVASGGKIGSPWDCTGVICYPVLLDSCPCNQQQPAPIIGPQPIGPIPPKPPADSCANLPADRTQWTPWQVANCGIGTIEQLCPTPIVQCPAPIVSMPVAEICSCIKDTITTNLPVPVDLNQPLAFIFAPDDASWKKQALEWSGKWLQDFNDSNDYGDWSHKVLGEIPEPTIDIEA